jgi:hypothetical protein
MNTYLQNTTQVSQLGNKRAFIRGQKHSHPIIGSKSLWHLSGCFVLLLVLLLGSVPELLAQSGSSASKTVIHTYKGTSEVFQVPNGVTQVSVYTRGASGGNGGGDAASWGGSGARGEFRTHTASGLTSIHFFTSYVGSQGGNGADGASGYGNGKGAKGFSPYGELYSGGLGGGVGGQGSSGGGGGGGAASVVTLNNSLWLVAAGGGGGGGAAQFHGGINGSTVHWPYTSTNNGKNGQSTWPDSDGGGSGAGGGGSIPGGAGWLYSHSGEYYGGGGSRGLGYAGNLGGIAGWNTGVVEYTYTVWSGTISGPASVCSGSSATLTLNNYAGSTIQWYRYNPSTGVSTYVGAGVSVNTGSLTANTTFYARVDGVVNTAHYQITVRPITTTPAFAQMSNITANSALLLWGNSTGDGVVTYYWAIGKNNTSFTYDAGYQQRGTTSNTFFDVSGLDPASLYYLKVYASAGCGISSTRTSGAYYTLPEAPVIADATNIRANSFTANWNASTGASAYFLDIATDANFNNMLSGYNNLNVGNVINYAVSGLNRETTYYYRVRANGNGGVSVNSNTSNVTTLGIDNYLVVAAGGGQIADQTAGEFFFITITARDAFNATVSDFSGTVNLSTTSEFAVGYGGTSDAFSNGVLSNYLVSLIRYGTNVTLTASLDGKTGTSNEFLLSTAPLAYFTIVANPGGGSGGFPEQEAKAGTTFSVLVKMYDEFHNLKLDYNPDGISDDDLDVSFTASATPSPRGNAPLIPASGDRTFTAGEATISGFTFFNAQEEPGITITETLTGSVGTTAPIIVWPEILDNFLLREEVPQTHSIGGVRVTASENFSTKVTARDQYYNIKRDYVGHINFKSSNDAIVQFPSGLQPFVSADQGVRTFTNANTIPTTGNYWLRVAASPDAFKTGDLQNIVVRPGSQDGTNSELYFTSQPGVITYPETPAVVAGDYISVTIIPRDAGGNLLCDCQDVRVFLNGVDEHRTGAPADGIPAFETIWVTDNHDGSYTALVRVTDLTRTNVITASVNETPISATLEVNVTLPDVPSLATSEITADPDDITADGFSTITVQLKDQFGNNRTTNDGILTLSISGLGNGIIVQESVSMSADYEATYIDNGQYCSFFKMNGVGLGTATISGAFNDDDAINGNMVNDATVNVTHGVATQLVIHTQPAITSAIAGVAFTDQPVIHISDQWGNLVDTDGASPMVSVTGETGNGELMGTLTATATEGIASFSELYCILAETGVSLRFSATGVSDVVSQEFEVVHNIPNYMVVSAAETLPLQNEDDRHILYAGKGQNITVSVFDTYGNPATRFEGSKPISFLNANPSPDPATSPTIKDKDDAAVAFGTPVSLNFTAGEVTTEMTLFKVENTAIITRCSIPDYNDGVVAGLVFIYAQGVNSLSVNVHHGVATNLRIDSQPSDYVRAGEVLVEQPVIGIYDDYGNRASSDSSTIIEVSANGSDEIVGTKMLTAVDGQVTYTDLSYETMETITMEFTSDPVLASVASNSIEVDHNAAARFVFTTKPDFVRAGGQRGAYVVTRHDAYGNLVDNVVTPDGTDLDIAETVYLFTDGLSYPFLSAFYDAATGGNVIASININDGATTASFWYYSTEAGDHLITGSDKSLLDDPDEDITNAVHDRLEVIPAALSHFIVSGVGTDVGNGWTEHYYGDSQSITVEAIDILGNRKTNYSGTITFNLTDGQAAAGTNYPVDYTFTAGEEVQYDNGIRTFNNAILFTRPSFEHPSYPDVEEWWVTVVDIAQPSKYGSQVKIRVIPRPIVLSIDQEFIKDYGDVLTLGTYTGNLNIRSGANPALDPVMPYKNLLTQEKESIVSVDLTSSGEPADAFVGTHSITLSNATAGEDTNLNYYDITYSFGTLEVVCPPIEITVPQDIYTFDNDATFCGKEVTFADLNIEVVGKATPTISYYEVDGETYTTSRYFEVGTTWVTVVAHNQCQEFPGEESTDFRIEILDVEAPRLTGAPYVDLTVYDACFIDEFTVPVGVPAFNPASAVIGYEDNCGIHTATLTSTSVTGDNCDWTVHYTYSIIDIHNNELTGQVYVHNGKDLTPPDLADCVPADLNDTFECAGLDGNEAAAIDWNQANINYLMSCATDLCGTVTVTSNYDFANLDPGCGFTGVLTVTYTVTDECGNFTTIDGVFTIIDTTKPDLTVCDSGNLDYTHECNGLDGNEAAAIDWNQDNIDYLMGCATDLCGTVTVTSNYNFADLAEACGFTGVLTVTYTVTDECGNFATIDGVFTIIDTTKPDLTVCDSGNLDYTHECNGLDGNEAAAIDWNQANINYLMGCATDLCGTVTVTSNYDFADLAKACGFTGVLTVTYTVTDECGNFATIDGVFTIIDTTKPDLTVCDSGNLDYTHECNGLDGNEAAAIDWNQDNIDYLMGCATDLCGTVTVTSNYNFADLAEACGFTGVLTVTYTVTDECGNFATIDGVFTIIDITPPSLIDEDVTASSLNKSENNWCFEAIEHTADPASLETAVAALYQDECGDVTVTYVPASTETFGDNCSWTATFTFTVKDECGNFADNAVVVYTGGDTEDPVIEAITDQIRDVDIDQCDYLIKDGEFDPVITDNCGIGTVTVVLTGATNATFTATEVSLPSLNGVTLNSGVTTVTWTVADACGNESEESFTVLVRPRALSGTVEYYRRTADNDPLQGFRVSLLDAGYEVIASTLTDASGNYVFSNQDHIVAAAYIEVSSPLPHSGIGAVDALAILQNSVPPAHSAYNPKAFIDHVANVWRGVTPFNPTTGPPHNALDARYVLQRRVNIIDFFDAGDWAFYAEAEGIAFDNFIGESYQNGTVTPERARIAYNLEFCKLDILVRAFGDVVGNLNLSAQTKSADHIHSEDVTEVEEGEIFELPLIVSKDVSFNATTIDLMYDRTLVEIMEVHSFVPEAFHKVQSDQVMLAWAGLSPHMADAGDTLLVLTMRTLGPVSAHDIVFMKGNEMEFVDEDLSSIPGVGLLVSRIATGTEEVVGIIAPEMGGIALEVFPNPFRNELNLGFNLEVTSDVHIMLINAMGARVADFGRQNREPGRHEITLSARDYSLEPGLYFVRMTVDDGSQVHYLVKRVVYMR